MNTNSSTWFQEPTTTDNTYAGRAEHTLDWLRRSTLPRAKDCRRFLNEHISYLPEQYQQKIIHDLRERWHSTFFELINARMLQQLGADISIEDENADGKRPDFTAHFPDATVIVEAKSPVVNSEAGETASLRIPLLDYIESKIPKGWLVSVCELPQIGKQQSQKPFQRIIERMLAIEPAKSNDTEIDLVERFGDGKIHLHLIPSSKNYTRLGWETPITVFDNTRSRIEHCIKGKRRQVRNSEFPVLLAIQASSLSSDYEDFDIAIFGADCTFLNRNHNIEKTEFLPNGLFNKNRVLGS